MCVRACVGLGGWCAAPESARMWARENECVCEGGGGPVA